MAIADIPPPALSTEEFNRRVKNGAKTFEEIDPEFWAWNLRMEKEMRIKWILLLSTLVLFVCGTIAIIAFNLYQEVFK